MAVGWGVLVLGLLVAVYGITYPASAASTQSYTILPSYSYSVDGNGYHSQGASLTAGQTVRAAVTMNVSTVFDFLIMNTSQYRNYYGCAPACRQPFANGTGISPAFLVNATVTPSISYNKTFTAPKSDTYYFVFDNSLGTNRSEYLMCFGAAGVCNGPTATGTFSLGSSRSVTNYSTNWLFVAPGALLLVVGGGVASMMGRPKKTKQM